MTTKVKLDGPLDLSASTRINKKVTKAAAPKAATQVARKLQRHTQAGYKNAVAQVDHTLLNPRMSGIASASRNTVFYKDTTGKRGWFRSSVWAALSRRYASRKPRSSTFWLKRGKLSQVFSAKVNQGLATTRARTERISYRKAGPTAYISIAFSTLPDPMDTYIRRAFMEGLAGGATPRFHWADTDGVTKDSLGKFVYPESQRPFIAQMTSTLGRKLLTILRSIG